ncbi:MAG: AmmeMemoRadiSam system radical SAM enzyme [Desulfovibrionaceae bacterium]|jgi:pyruvate formate lyase activating enzyme|nr:AmmeMemoRadiSam system radical SAM enzyme [Desulfovibrionaceae bacterium]
MAEALLYKPLKNSQDSRSATVQCGLCAHYCVIKDGTRGKCGVRENRSGVLHSLVADVIAAANLDPVEKKPLFHFMPGTRTFSIGAPGCNLCCSFCQNASLSQEPRARGAVRGQRVTPEEIVRAARESGAASISYTYSEPTIFFELMYPTAQLAVQAGLKNILVSNGFMSPECLEMLGPYIHAANIDLKAFTEEFYKERCGARLAPVLENLRHIVRLGWWLEVTTLVIPGLNDTREELVRIATFIRDELGAQVPWHVSRFHPCHELTDRGPTPTQTLETAWQVGLDVGLAYVYLGNVPGHGSESTSCPSCGEVVVERNGFSVLGTHWGERPGRCACGHDVPGVDW